MERGLLPSNQKETTMKKPSVKQLNQKPETLGRYADHLGVGIAACVETVYGNDPRIKRETVLKAESFLRHWDAEIRERAERLGPQRETPTSTQTGKTTGGTVTAIPEPAGKAPAGKGKDIWGARFGTISHIINQCLRTHFDDGELFTSAEVVEQLRKDGEQVEAARVSGHLRWLAARSILERDENDWSVK
jgi:hypothetical protein